MSISIEERFIRKVDVRERDERWSWKGGLDTPGYGQFRIGSVMVRAHRIAYFLRHKKLPTYNKNGDKLFVCHHCDNKLCCNPDHLFLGTREDNFIDAHRKGLMKNASAKFYAEEIWLIRKLKVSIKGYSRTKYKYPTRYIAKMFKTTHYTILAIWNSTSYLCRKGYYI